MSAQQLAKLHQYVSQLKTFSELIHQVKSIVKSIEEAVVEVARLVEEGEEHAEQQRTEICLAQDMLKTKEITKEVIHD